MKKYGRNQGCYATVIKVLENNHGMILSLDNGEEAYCRGYKSIITEESLVLCVIRKSAYRGRRMLAEVVDVVEYATCENECMGAA